MEDYLEAIYQLEKDRRIARVRDIARRLGVKMSSVTSALKSLNSRGLISYDPHQYITLTERGMAKAREIVRRHEVLKRFLSTVLKIEDEIAEDNACRIEHHLDPEVIDRLVGLAQFVETCPVDQTRWLDGVREGCEDCAPCLDAAKKKVFDRAKAQREALAEGMTLAVAEVGSQVMIESIKGSAKLRKELSVQGLESGVIAQIEDREGNSGILHLNIRGYHVSVTKGQASKILVKPV
jgi:DtxR family Mn-dependent transcriptional regulator